MTFSSRSSVVCAAAAVAVSVLTLTGCARTKSASIATPPTTAPSVAAAVDPVIAKIKDEGLNRSQVMQHADYLTNVIGPRLTGSPNLTRAHEWTRDELTRWGLQNAKLEPWGPFGRGWSLERYSMQMTEPQPMMLASLPKAWSPGISDKPVTAEVVYVKANTASELKTYEGKLKGKIVFVGDPKKLEPPLEAQAKRFDDGRLERMANLPLGSTWNGDLATTKPSTPATQPTPGAELMASTPNVATTSPTTAPAPGPASTLSQRRFAARVVAMAQKEGALVVVEPSITLDGSGYWVAGVTMPPTTQRSTTQPTTEPSTETPATQPVDDAAAASAFTAGLPKPWTSDPKTYPPQVSMSSDHYARILRLIESGATVKATIDLKVKDHENVEVFNTIAEIPGTDLKDEIVMVGAHLDSWHAATGATDNAAGVACAMEAVRILKALDLKPRRTIRIALWGGEEIGLLGSSAYVKQNFATAPENAAAKLPPPGKARKPVSTLPGYEKLSVYFNLDNGGGKIRGIYAQSNLAAVPIFNDWLRPFHDVGAKTVSLRNATATDHIAFDRVGLPGFQFIQDPLDYMNRTHHTTLDTYERLQPDDLKQASTIMAAFVWNAANMDDRFPRKPAE